MMTPLQLSHLATRFQWHHDGADVQCTGVAIDSRKVAAGDLFVALRGARVDGHSYLAQAQAAGAVAAIVEAPVSSDLPQLLCANSAQALAQLAQHNVEQFTAPLIALTGSAGKTSTRAMVEHILGAQAPTLATIGNLNNEIGAPLTALRLSPEHRFAVIEMGAAKQGDIAYLCRYIKPTVALVTNVGDAHIGGFGSEQGIARGKGEIYEALADDGIALINADSPYAEFWQASVAGKQLIRFGCRNRADVFASDVSYALTGSEFNLHFDGKVCRVSLAVPGAHNVMNALAAAACAIAVGVELSAIAMALNSFEGVGSRLSFMDGLAGAQIINDSYNANPSAFRAAIDVLAYAPGPKILVMGAMAELGEQSLSAHHAVGAYAADQGIDQLFAVGEDTRAAVAAFGADGHWFPTKAALTEALRAALAPTQTVLVKGSRSAGMETVVTSISTNAETSIVSARGGVC